MGLSTIPTNFGRYLLRAAMSAALVSAVPVSGAAEPSGEPAPWWNEQWTLRKEITINGGSSGAGLSEPAVDPVVLVRLMDGEYQFGLAREDGSDLRFIAADGKTVLPHGIEKYDSLMGEGFAWVRLPEVKAGGASTFWLYSGNAAGSLDGAAAVPATLYDAATSLVYHFNDRGAAPADASGNGNSAAAAGLAPSWSSSLLTLPAQHAVRGPQAARASSPGDGSRHFASVRSTAAAAAAAAAAE